MKNTIAALFFVAVFSLAATCGDSGGIGGSGLTDQKPQPQPTEGVER